MNLTLSMHHSKPLFSQYKKPYMVPFQKTHKNPKEKHKDSLETVNQRGSFSQNILKSIFFWLGPFLVLIFEFKITNYLLLIMNRFYWREQ